MGLHAFLTPVRSPRFLEKGLYLHPGRSLGMLELKMAILQVAHNAVS